MRTGGKQLPKSREDRINGPPPCIVKPRATILIVEIWRTGKVEPLAEQDEGLDPCSRSMQPKALGVKVLLTDQCLDDRTAECQMRKHEDALGCWQEGGRVEPLELRIALPGWVEEFLRNQTITLPVLEDRMRLVVELARENIRRETGGPFGAAIFDESGRLVAPGVNLVLSGKCSILHAEMVAIALAHKRVGRHDLGEQGRYQYELVTAAEPCAMCFGAIPWSGVSRVVCGTGTRMSAR